MKLELVLLVGSSACSTIAIRTFSSGHATRRAYLGVTYG
jgi:hypothetical protein